MGFLYGLFNQLRDGSSAITPLTKEEKIENHFMKGKGAHTSYIQLLQFVLLLLKPYAKNYEAGNQFIECIHRSVEEENDLDVLMTKVLQCEEADMTHWAKEVQTYGGNGILALDVLMLWQRMEAGDEGLEAVINFFSFLDMKQEIIEEAAEAVKLITEKDEGGVLRRCWQILTPNVIKGYFSDWNPDEQMQLDATVSLFIHDQVTDAYPLFKKLATRGNRRAMYFMGEYYRFGWAGLPVNKKLGFHYHHLGAEKGEPLCQLQLAYEEGANKEQILQEIIPKILQLAQAGDIIAEDELGDAFCGNVSSLAAKYGGVVKVDEKAEFWRKKSAENSYWRAAMGLAAAYRDGSRVNQDAGKAIAYYEKVYELHREHAGEAANRIGNVYYEQKNYVKQVEWWKKSAEEGYDWSMSHLAACYRDGAGVQEDQEQAIAWFQKAYELHGDAAGDAANGIGLIYNGQKNYVKQVEWYKKSAEEGYDWGMYNLAGCYSDGEGVQEDQEQAIAWFRKAYELHGDAAGDAANKIGNIYYWQKNYVKKVEWYKKSAEEGCDWGMRNLGMCYRDGEGVQEDQEQAIAWYQKAYELHGDAAGDVANQIGVIYYKQGNHNEEFEWFKKGAAEGFDWCMSNLGTCYRYGRGVSINYDKAREWYQKAIDCHGEAEKTAREYLSQI